MNRVTINGKIFEVEGRSISVQNDRISVDGVQIDSGQAGPITRIKVEGDLFSVQSDRSVECGDVQGDVIANGAVSCDDVQGNVRAGGSVNCDAVGGNVDGGGSVNCDRVAGSVIAGGSVVHS